MKHFVMLLCISVWAVAAHSESGVIAGDTAGPARKAAGHHFEPGYRFLSGESAFADKAFYFLTVMQQLPEVRNIIRRDTVLQRIYDNALRKLHTLTDQCKDSTDCYLSGWCWPEEDNQAICRELSLLSASHPAIKQMIRMHLRACGNYRLYDSLDNNSLLPQLWKDAANAMNYCFRAYMKNEGLRYPAIDSTHYPANGKYYRELLREMLQMLEKRAPRMQLFFEPGLAIAAELLSINNRDEATRYALDKINAAAYAGIRSTHWGNYPYSAILVLGEGPEDMTVPLSPHGKYRCELAAMLYRRHQAPFIILSGGHAHPNETPWSEAIEMKKYLLQKWNIPAAAILMDPVARHTTTNFRNGARFIFRQRMPARKPMLGISGESPVDYIFSARFADRCVKELGYRPFSDLRRLDAFSFSFYPAEESLQVNAMDPLDP